MFTKGNNLGTGRPKGSKNKNSQSIRDAFEKLIENNLPKLQKDLNSLEPKDRLKMIIDLASYVLPKLRSIEAKIEDEKEIRIYFDDTPIGKDFKVTDIYKKNDEILSFSDVE